MGERPIKKSERAERSSAEPANTPQSQDERRSDRGGQGKSSGNRKGRGDRQEKTPAVPQALMRGPKPKPAPEPPKLEESTPETDESEGSATDESPEDQ
ncbi:MAG: hypothetical protein WBA43_11970 [Elainellaceae cyanobacterium]|jgi:hypothetical protein|uniref:hypothetical protein n=1 Tax=Leptolyngbya sp. CCY15150 TaxID=2767772 RepID=UPI00194F766D|nr:hypothetical protein [Leptolyngbya sp. CCY15150]